MQGMAEPLLGLRPRRGPTSRGPEVPSLGPAPEATAPPSMGARGQAGLGFQAPCPEPVGSRLSQGVDAALPLP